MQFSFLILSSMAILATASPRKDPIVVIQGVDSCSEAVPDPSINNPNIGACVLEGAVYGKNGPQMVCTNDQDSTCDDKGQTCLCCVPDGNQQAMAFCTADD